MGELKQVPLDQIRENKVALRDVNRDSEEYQELIDSIRENGVMNSISLRVAVDEDTNEEYYELIDGLHRFSASKDAGLDSIPAQVIEADEGKVLELQVIGNLAKIETKPSEYTAQLKRILNMNPLMTLAELAAKVHKSPAWVNQRMSISTIKNDEIRALIDDGEIILANAYALAKLPEEEQLDWCEAAQTETAEEFVNKVNTRVKEIRDAKRKGRDAAPAEFIPSAHLQKVGDIKAEQEQPDAVRALIVESDTTDPVEAAKLALAWVLHLDPTSVAVQKDKWEAKQREKAERKAAREKAKAERKAKKAAEAAEKAAAAAEEASESMGLNEAEVL